MAVQPSSTDALVQDAIVWASQHGLVVGLGGDAPPAALIHAPLSLLPVAFPGSRFKQAKAAMLDFNTLIDRVAADEAYLSATLAKTAQQDPFTGRLLALLHDSAPARAAAAAGGREVVLGIHRSDYMLDQPSGGFLQVELNTIAASFACLSTITTQLHGYVFSRLLASRAAAAGSGGRDDARQRAAELLAVQRLPLNMAMQGIARAMAAAVVAGGGEGAVMVMVVQPGERNAYDQQWLQQTLWDEHGITTHRLSLAEIPTALELQPADSNGNAAAAAEAAAGSGVPGRQRLVLSSTGQTVGLVYYRAGYTPNDYQSETEWQARRLIESSSAAKCPSVSYQLAGCKKVQQDLAMPGVVERFMGEQRGSALRQLFAGLWSLDDPADPATAGVISDALQHPERYVLKPQREGGGNNLYGPELVAELQAGLADGGARLAAFILMQRILPPPQRSIFVRNGSWLEDESLSELGIYGTFLRVGQQVVVNEEVGHLVRTKTSSSNEGGVAAGFAVLDSPLLAEPGEGLLPPLLDVAAAGSSNQGAASGGESGEVAFGATGGVLAAAKALL